MRQRSGTFPGLPSRRVHQTVSTEQAARGLVEQMAADPRDEVIGIGLDSLTTDAREAPERYVGTYELAGAGGPTTDSPRRREQRRGGRVLAIALDHSLRADRSGYQIVRDPSMIEGCRAEERSRSVAARGDPAILTRTYGWGDFGTNPIRSMVDAGLRVSLSCDSSCSPGSDLGTEYSRGIIGLAKVTRGRPEIVLNGVDAT